MIVVRIIMCKVLMIIYLFYKETIDEYNIFTKGNICILTESDVQAHFSFFLYMHEINKALVV